MDELDHIKHIRLLSTRARALTRIFTPKLIQINLNLEQHDSTNAATASEVSDLQTGPGPPKRHGGRIHPYPSLWKFLTLQSGNGPNRGGRSIPRLAQCLEKNDR
ncbi:hypothetical protein AVEN_54202-1 [Araneus ventricosus]|uniref:Uncharacterized protein n=1 Tax=Araneus ventricosus TaxID=182803 RepID=A0A4Y2VQY0_ARAVE|nr:hypothetical protein AVEN_54202-1 [Araneus ventricosus]